MDVAVVPKALLPNCSLTKGAKEIQPEEEMKDVLFPPAVGFLPFEKQALVSSASA